MNRPRSMCDDDSLRLLIDIDIDSDTRDSDLILEHVEGCTRCQQRLEELAASKDDWAKAFAVLQDRPSSEAFRPASQLVGEIRLQHGCDESRLWTDAMARQMLSPPSHPEMMGRLGRYEVERLLGAGGMGVVFKAFDSELHRTVAIKVLAPYLSSSAAARKRFAREAKAAAAVVHEHVVPIYNVETEGDLPFIVMHYVAGESLQGRLDRFGSLELCETLRIGMQVASGLAAAHAQGLVHRDIKPSNVLLEDGIERALLADFGLARTVDDATLTRSGFHPGTPQYMSPEQARGESVDARSDLFSLGSMLYTMCTGKPPFQSDTSLGVMRRITDTEPRPIREVNAEIPPWLCALIKKLMSKHMEDRFDSAGNVARLLEECIAHVQSPSRNPIPRAISRPTSSIHLIFRKLGMIMEDKRLLSLVAFGLLLIAVLLPWPIAAVGRDEPAMIFGALAAALSFCFAVLSRSEYFSRVVLWIAGIMVAIGLILGGLSVPIWFARQQELVAETEWQRAKNAETVAVLSQWRKRVERALPLGSKKTEVETWMKEHIGTEPFSEPVTLEFMQSFPLALGSARDKWATAVWWNLRADPLLANHPKLKAVFFFDEDDRLVDHFEQVGETGNRKGDANASFNEGKTATR